MKLKKGRALGQGLNGDEGGSKQSVGQLARGRDEMFGSKSHCCGSQRCRALLPVRVSGETRTGGRLSTVPTSTNILYSLFRNVWMYYKISNLKIIMGNHLQL